MSRTDPQAPAPRGSRLPPARGAARMGLAIALLAGLGLGPSCKKTPPRARTPILVGAVLPLTGPQAAYGVSAKSGIELATRALNEGEGLLGRRVEVLYIDDQSDRAQAVAATERLVKKDGAHLILGELSSAASSAMAPLAERARTPMISPAATAPELTQHGPYVFRACFADAYQAEVMAKYAAEVWKVKRVGILRDLGSTYSLGLAELFETSAKKRGLEVVAVTEFAAADADLEGPLGALVEAKAEAVYLPTYVEPVRRVLAAAEKMKAPFRFLGSDGWDAADLVELGAAAEGHVFVSHFAADDPSPDVQNFVRAYRHRFNETPDAYAALGYDAARVAYDAVARAKKTEPEAIRAALAGTRGFAGVTGTFDFDESGDPAKTAVLLEVKGGARVLVERLR